MNILNRLRPHGLCPEHLALVGDVASDRRELRHAHEASASVEVHERDVHVAEPVRHLRDENPLPRMRQWGPGHRPHAATQADLRQNGYGASLCGPN